MYLVELVKLGNHYYPKLNHEDPSDLKLDPKFDRMLNMINKDEYHTPIVYLYEIQSVMPEDGVLKIKDEDITRYLTTNDDFDLRVTVNKHHFKLSSKLYTLLENNLHLDLCKTLYKIEIW